MRCPECGSASIQTLGKRNWRYPVGLLLILPPVLALLHQASSLIDYRCAHCGLRFGRRTGPARSAFVLMILSPVVFVLLLVFAAVYWGPSE